MKVSSALAAFAMVAATSGAAVAATPMTPGATPGSWSFAGTADQSFSFDLAAPGPYDVGASALGFTFSPFSFIIDSVTLSSTEGGAGVSFKKVSDTNWAFVGSLASGLHYVNVNVTGTGFYGGNVLAVSAVPEPSSLALVLAGLAAMGFVAQRRRPE